ncbi:hypothetical protein TNCV_3295961 [Trichonephila clavipes]|uniref:Uncharacterized protein n=1 Tax=Trichonephila clavipes TaxID=2585209 RepID=A0A8X6VKB6_TRICX|nr:hypothetical protein TNCV_3295961 [Trichonephila clavipes]
MIMKFEETGDLCVLPGRGWKPDGTEIVKVVAIAVVERASSSISSSASGRSGTHGVGESVVDSTKNSAIRFKIVSVEDARDANAETSISQNKPYIFLPISG